MATPRSPPRTRAQSAAVPTVEAEVLRTLMQEMAQLKEERQREQASWKAQLRERDDTLQRLQERLTDDQISRSNNIRASGDSVEASCVGGNASVVPVELGFKLKPDAYDGLTSLREYFVQFAYVARANGWDDSARAVALVSCLRGKARSVLDGLPEGGFLGFRELKERLELRFGESQYAQEHYLQFTSRRQKPGEDLAELGADLERLSRLVYAECSLEVRDKIACSQFISALMNNSIRRTLQLEGVSSLRRAIERAKTIRVINNSSHEEKNVNSGIAGENRKRWQEREEKRGFQENPRKREGKRPFSHQGKNTIECWLCGEKGHVRAVCPRSSGN